jgi:hypothetical protein
LDLPPIKVGSDYEFTIEILDDNEAAQDTTNWTMELKGRTPNANGEEVFSLSVSSGITHTPAEGKFAVKISNAITSLFNVSKIVWDVKITDSNGDITFPFEGTFTVLATVTRS